MTRIIIVTTFILARTVEFAWHSLTVGMSILAALRHCLKWFRTAAGAGEDTHCISKCILLRDGLQLLFNDAWLNKLRDFRM